MNRLSESEKIIVSIYLFLCINGGGNPFHSHHGSGLPVAHFFDNAIGPVTQITNFLQIVGLHNKRSVIDGDGSPFVQIGRSSSKGQIKYS